MGTLKRWPIPSKPCFLALLCSLISPSRTPQVHPVETGRKWPIPREPSLPSLIPLYRFLFPHTSTPQALQVWTDKMTLPIHGSLFPPGQMPQTHQVFAHQSVTNEKTTKMAHTFRRNPFFPGSLYIITVNIGLPCDAKECTRTRCHGQSQLRLERVATRANPPTCPLRGLRRI